MKCLWSPSGLGLWSVQKVFQEFFRSVLSVLFETPGTLSGHLFGHSGVRGYSGDTS